MFHLCLVILLTYNHGLPFVIMFNIDMMKVYSICCQGHNIMTMFNNAFFKVLQKYMQMLILTCIVPKI